MIDLAGIAGRPCSEARSINSHGRVVGRVFARDPRLRKSSSRAVLFTRGAPVPLRGLDARGSWANGINDAGAVVGSIDAWWHGGAPYATGAFTRADEAMSQLDSAKERFREQRARAITMITAILSDAQRGAISKSASALASMVDAAAGGRGDTSSSSEGETSSWAARRDPDDGCRAVLPRPPSHCRPV